MREQERSTHYILTVNGVPRIMSPADSPLRGITKWGGPIARTFAEGIVRNQALVRRAAWKLAEVFLQDRANQAVAHADRFCSLPWYRRWWEMVHR